ncbi:hypothetical protein PCASD_20192 [Puccinia coronata f. sp. avenae]|uniref:No apical meristem-associated C-terminal domain-containing protein n=1 Tax=Puccinia coronata f. sp. avenae TaxID=200324 RepID=A0A2N5SMZ3_9BASI|nr:hypothetical protein PCASD_20192 [Puccinia coronata f. sp. avenae]
MYAASEGQAFAHLRCYHVLSPLPKWANYCDNLEARKADNTPKTIKADRSNIHSTPTPFDISLEIGPLDNPASQADAKRKAQSRGSYRAKEEVDVEMDDKEEDKEEEDEEEDSEEDKDKENEEDKENKEDEEEEEDL